MPASHRTPRFRVRQWPTVQQRRLQPDRLPVRRRVSLRFSRFLIGADGRMTFRQAAAADRWMSRRHGLWHSADGTTRSFLRHSRHPMSLAGLLLYTPLIALALEDI